MTPPDAPARPAPLFGTVDYTRVLSAAVRHWYLTVAALAVSLGYAHFKVRYTPKSYPVTASILVKEREDASDGKLLFNNPLVSTYRNQFNDPYLIRSYPLVHQTLSELNFGASFHKEGRVLTTEVYRPQISARVLDGSSGSFYLRYLGGTRFELSGSPGGPATKPYNFGDTAVFGGLTVVFTPREPYGHAIGANETVLFTYSDPSGLTGDYVSRLGATWAEDGVGVINLNITGANAAKEADFLSALVRQYQRFDLEKKNLVASRTIEFIDQQLSAITDSLRAAERRLEDFKSRGLLAGSGVGEQAKRLYDKAADSDKQRAELALRSKYHQYLLGYLEKDDGLGKVILPSSVGIGDPVLHGLVSKMVEAQLSLKMFSGSGNPLAGEARAHISELRRDIMESVRGQQSSDSIRLAQLDLQSSDAEGRLRSLPHSERMLASIQRNYTLLENLYVFLLQKKAEAGISKASTTSAITVVNPPMPAGGPIGTSPPLAYLAATAAGLALPLLLFVLLELANVKVQSRGDIEKITSMPVLAGVGHKEGKGDLEVLGNPKGFMAESFRSLRSDLSYFLGKRDRAVIMVTSSISGEGKTFTSINLSSVLSLSGRKTLLVGADMRKPRLYGDFGLRNDVGLSSYLAGMADFASVVQGSGYPGLDLVTGGPVPPNPSELLIGGRLGSFLAEARGRYDFVVIDTPPILIVSDAFAISDHADHCLFVVRQRYTPKPMLRTVDGFHRVGKLRNVSVVLNDVHSTGLGSYGYEYGAKNRYGSSYYH
ncbi:MAG: polysaccharide biosynthesis tyrosine autokinase [Flammeovirgaceae bacterium]